MDAVAGADQAEEEVETKPKKDPLRPRRLVRRHSSDEQDERDLTKFSSLSTVEEIEEAAKVYDYMHAKERVVVGDDLAMSPKRPPRGKRSLERAKTNASDGSATTENLEEENEKDEEKEKDMGMAVVDDAEDTQGGRSSISIPDLKPSQADSVSGDEA